MKAVWIATAFIFALISWRLSFTDSVNGAANKGWLPVRAKVLEAAAAPGPLPGRSSEWEPCVVYKYKVKGKFYTAQQFSLPNPRMSEVQIKTLLGQYKPGTTVTAYYNPARPSNAYISKKVGSSNVWINFAMVAGSMSLLLVLGAVSLVTTRNNALTRARRFPPGALAGLEKANNPILTKPTQSFVSIQGSRGPET